MLNKGYRFISMMAIFTVVLLLSGCFATSTPTAAPPMIKHSSGMPTAAMLPIMNSYEQTTADFVTQYLEACLKDRNVFKFTPKTEVDQAVSDSGFDMDKMFGLKASQYASFANTLGVDYVIHGTMAVRKTLKFTGWRRDVDLSIRIYDGRTGKKVDSWRSMTDFAWAKGGTELDGQKMAEFAANHTCTKMMQRTY